MSGVEDLPQSSHKCCNSCKESCSKEQRSTGPTRTTAASRARTAETTRIRRPTTTKPTQPKTEKNIDQMVEMYRAKLMKKREKTGKSAEVEVEAVESARGENDPDNVESNQHGPTTGMTTRAMAKSRNGHQEHENEEGQPEVKRAKPDEDHAEKSNVNEDGGAEDTARKSNVNEDGGAENNAKKSNVNEDGGAEDTARKSNVNEDGGAEDNARKSNVNEEQPSTNASCSITLFNVRLSTQNVSPKGIMEQLQTFDIQVDVNSITSISPLKTCHLSELCWKVNCEIMGHDGEKVKALLNEPEYHELMHTKNSRSHGRSIEKYVYLFGKIDDDDVITTAVLFAAAKIFVTGDSESQVLLTPVEIRIKKGDDVTKRTIGEVFNDERLLIPLLQAISNRGIPRFKKLAAQNGVPYSKWIQVPGKKDGKEVKED